jgi:putative transposase
VYPGRLEDAGIEVSRDGRGRTLDNVFVEQLWRSVKHEDIYMKDYERVADLESGLSAYFRFYDEERPISLWAIGLRWRSIEPGLSEPNSLSRRSRRLARCRVEPW